MLVASAVKEWPDRRDAIQAAFDAILGIVDEVLAIDKPAADRAKEIVLAYSRLSPRDAIHIAVMEQRGVRRILSFDAGFDCLPGDRTPEALIGFQGQAP